MYRDVKQAWIKALRSDLYPQGRQHLRAGNKYCCLGVLCDLAVRDGVDVTITQVGRTQLTNELLYRYNNQGATLPKEVMAWAGLHTRDPRVKTSDNSYHPLSHLNDNGMPFTSIADMIEDSIPEEDRPDD